MIPQTTLVSIDTLFDKKPQTSNLKSNNIINVFQHINSVHSNQHFHSSEITPFSKQLTPCVDEKIGQINDRNIQHVLLNTVIFLSNLFLGFDEFTQSSMQQQMCASRAAATTRNVPSGPALTLLYPILVDEITRAWTIKHLVYDDCHQRHLTCQTTRGGPFSFWSCQPRTLNMIRAPTFVRSTLSDI